MIDRWPLLLFLLLGLAYSAYMTWFWGWFWWEKRKQWRREDSQRR